VARYRVAGEDLLKQAIAAATEARPGWAALGVIVRGVVLRRAVRCSSSAPRSWPG